jgi:hypothetical protein
VIALNDQTDNRATASHDPSPSSEAPVVFKLGRFYHHARLSRWLERSSNLALAGTVAIIIAGTAAGVAAHSPDVPFYDWLVTRQRPDHPGHPCCGAGPNSDQYFSDRYEQDADGGYTVWVEPHEGGPSFGAPAHVPPERVNVDDVNPIGRGVIWISVDWLTQQGPPVPGVVFCFEPAPGL